EQQGGDGRDDGEHAEGADVADPVDQPLAGQRPDEEADEIRREHDADQERGFVARGHLQAHDGADDAERALDQDNPEQDWNDRLYRFPHDASPAGVRYSISGACPRFSSPLAMMRRWISLAPSQMRSTRSSR